MNNLTISIDSNKLYLNDRDTGVKLLQGGNCKLIHFHNMMNFIYHCDAHSLDVVDTLKRVFRKLPILVDFNVSSEKYFNILVKNFEYYYAISTPTGYNPNLKTYHILIKNTYSTRAHSYIDYLREQEPITNEK